MCGTSPTSPVTWRIGMSKTNAVRTAVHTGAVRSEPLSWSAFQPPPAPDLRPAPV